MMKPFVVWKLATPIQHKLIPNLIIEKEEEYSRFLHRMGIQLPEDGFMGER